jgi:peptidyl-tRNA hydrolase
MATTVNKSRKHRLRKWLLIGKKGIVLKTNKKEMLSERQRNGIDSSPKQVYESPKNT